MLPRSEIADGCQRRIAVYMTGTGAIAQFAHRVACARAVDLSMFITFIVIGVTACAIGLIGRELPDIVFIVAPMAVVAVERSAVSAGVGCGLMGK